MNNWKLRHSFTGNATSDVQTVNGYLADPAYHLTTNLLLQSNQFDTNWFNYNSTESAGESGYDAGSDAWLLSKTGASGLLQQYIDADGLQTYSIYAKAGSLSFLMLRYKNTSGQYYGTYFDLANGQVETETAQIIESKITTVGGGWYRCSITFNQPLEIVFVYPADSDGGIGNAVTGDIYIQDAQLEEGTQATTYVETTTEPVTLPDTFNVTVVPDGKEYAAPLFIPRTNLILQSNQFDTTWSNYNSTDTGGQSGYDGSDDAWLIEKTGGAGLMQQSISASGLHTFSVYAKQGTVNGVRVQIGAGTNRYTFFDLNAGTIGTSNAISNTIESMGNGWYRCAVTADEAAISLLRIYVTDGEDTSGTTGSIYIQDAQFETGSVATEYIPTTTAAVTRDWSAFGRVQNQVPGICNGTHTHTGAASGSGIAATTITGSGSGATFAYDFDTLGVLTTLTADGAGSGYKVGDKLSIDTTEGHTIEFRLVEGSNAATVSVSMGAAKPNKPIPFPVSKMRVEGLTDRTVLFMDERSQYVFPKPTPYLLDTYEGAAAAYSLRRLRSAYTGPAVRVRRASNNDELDIYFNRDGSLDTATLEAFCAGTDGFVKVWYDQGQGGNDAEQTSTASQPQIVSSGSVVTENGKPAVYFDGANDQFQLSYPDLYGQSVLDAYIAYATNDNSYVLFSNRPTEFKYSLLVEDGSSSTLLVSNYGTPDLFVNGNQYAINYGTTTRDELHTELVRDQMILEVHQGATTSNWSDFGFSNYGARELNGNVSEIILYNSDQSANRQGIEDNINEHYGIYEFSGLLDDYSGAAAAYSLRRLSSTYTGPAIRVVKHDVGYPEMDIPFEDDGTLSVVLLEAFADGYDATVKVWYDQSGSGADLEQGTIARQGVIVSSGTVLVDADGLPYVNTLESTYDNPVQINQPFTAFAAAQFGAGYRRLMLGGVLWSPDLTNNRFNAGLNMTGTNALNFANKELYGILANGTSSEMRYNGTSDATGNVGTNAISTTTTIFSQAAPSNAGPERAYEMVIFSGDQSANFAGIESNMNDFYSIYP